MRFTWFLMNELRVDLPFPAMLFSFLHYPALTSPSLYTAQCCYTQYNPTQWLSYSYPSLHIVVLPYASHTTRITTVVPTKNDSDVIFEYFV